VAGLIDRKEIESRRTKPLIEVPARGEGVRTRTAETANNGEPRRPRTREKPRPKARRRPARRSL
jgi:hypothetical protein